PRSISLDRRALIVAGETMSEPPSGRGRRGPPAWRPRRPAGPGGGPDIFVVGGKRAVTEAVRSGRARRVLVVGGNRETQGLRMLLDVSVRAGLQPEMVGGEQLDGL